jgi:hypothetical protein
MGIFGGAKDARREEAKTVRQEAKAKTAKVKADKRELKNEKTKANIKLKAEGKPTHGFSVGVYRQSPKAKPTVRSNSKSVIEKNQKGILKAFEPPSIEGISRKDQFVRQIDSLKKHGEHRPQSTQKAIKQWVDGGCTREVYYTERLEYLNKLGLKKYTAKDMDNMTDAQWEEVDKMYVNLIVRDGTNLYDDLKSGKPKTTKKKATAKGKRK